MTRTGLKVNGNISLLIKITIVLLSFEKVQLRPHENAPTENAPTLGTARSHRKSAGTRVRLKLAVGERFRGVGVMGKPQMGRGPLTEGCGGAEGTHCSPFATSCAPSPTALQLPRWGVTAKHRERTGRAAGELSPGSPRPLCLHKCCCRGTGLPPPVSSTTFSSLQAKLRELF